MHLLQRVFPLLVLLLLLLVLLLLLPLPRHSLKKCTVTQSDLSLAGPEVPQSSFQKKLMLIIIRVAWPSGSERWTCNSETPSSSLALTAS